MKSWNCVGRVFLTVLAAASLVACGEGFVEDEEFDTLDQAQTVDEMSEEAFDERFEVASVLGELPEAWSH